MTTAQTTGWTAHEDYEGSVEQIAGLPPTEAQQARAGEVSAIADAVDQHAPLIDLIRSDLNSIVAGADGETLLALRNAVNGKEAQGVAQSLVSALQSSVDSQIATINLVISADDADFDTAQERLNELIRLANVLNGLAISNISGLQSALDGKEAQGVAAGLVGPVSESVDSLQSDFADLNLDAIAQTKDLTPVATCIYDTRNDSDDGAWRHTTHNTSWYQEDLNTATRGTRREPPSMPIVVAESSTVTLLDSDDPEQSMWTVYDFAGHTITSISAKNGHLLVGSNLGLTIINLISDTTDFYDASSVLSIVDNQVNDVAITVLDDAPIDPAIGLPVLTIAVATDGGVSVIKHDGSVVSGDYTGAIRGVSFMQDGTLCSWLGDYSVFHLPGTYKENGFSYFSLYFRAGGNDLPSSFTAVRGIAQSKGYERSDIAFDGGIARSILAGQAIRSNAGSLDRMTALITSSYNTGMMGGGNVLTALCSTDTSNLVGSGELVVNGDFSADSDWVKPAGYSISSGSMTYDGSGAQYSKLYQSLSGLTVGKLYAITFTLSGLSAGSLNFGFGASSAGAFELPQQTYSSDGTYTRYMTASISNHTLLLQNNDATQTFTIDNVSIKLADDDRSVNADGLIINGTLNRTVLGDGADMVEYSGFTASNYLEQPYHSAYDVGTGDFSIGFKAKHVNQGDQTIFYRAVDKTDHAPDKGINVWLHINQVKMNFDGVAYLSGDKGISDGLLHFYWIVKDGNTLNLYIDGRLVYTTTSFVVGSWDINSAGANHPVSIGAGRYGGNSQNFISDVKFETQAFSSEQVAKKYNDEKKFLSNPATLYGTSDQVNAIDHDECTDLLHAVTPDGRSVFDGLVRVDNTTTAATVVAAHDGLVVEG